MCLYSLFSFFFSSRRRHTRSLCDWSSDVCSSDLPLLGLLFGFSQHRAQGTSLVALIPPTGVLALMAYSKQGFLSWKTGLLLIPGVFLGGIAGGVLAKKIQPRSMRQAFAGVLVLLGVWQALEAWWR